MLQQCVVRWKKVPSNPWKQPMFDYMYFQTQKICCATMEELCRIWTFQDFMTHAEFYTYTDSQPKYQIFPEKS